MHFNLIFKKMRVLFFDYRISPSQMSAFTNSHWFLSPLSCYFSCCWFHRNFICFFFFAPAKLLENSKFMLILFRRPYCKWWAQREEIKCHKKWKLSKEVEKSRGRLCKWNASNVKACPETCYEWNLNMCDDPVV